MSIAAFQAVDPGSIPGQRRLLVVLKPSPSLPARENTRDLQALVTHVLVTANASRKSRVGSLAGRRNGWMAVPRPCSKVAWPSGLRRWIKAPVSSGAWVRIPPLPVEVLLWPQAFLPVKYALARSRPQTDELLIGRHSPEAPLSGPLRGQPPSGHSLPLRSVVAWPSGLRRWIKAPVSSGAWVQIPPLPVGEWFTRLPDPFPPSWAASRYPPEAHGGHREQALVV